MSSALLSGHWFRVAQLKPRLRGHVRVHRHVYRGKVGYVIHDRASGNHHRFNAAAYEVIRQFDGRHSMQAIWDTLLAKGSEETPTQDEIIRVLGQLNAADLLVLESSPDVAELLDRRTTRRQRQLIGRFLNPMSLRIPLWDPDRFLGTVAAWLRPLPAWLAWTLWAATVIPALLLAPAHWPELTRNFGERLLAADNLWVIAFAFPLLKAAHELAHGLAVKRGGGEVHETGLMFLMLYPIPYVDASGAYAFAGKGRRVWVGAAGMAVETWLAAIAFYFWLVLEPGLLRSVAYNVAVLGSVTTVLFNANPLLRYDGYFILSDLIEIPNLAARANRTWQYLVTRHLFGIRAAERPTATPAERRWLVAYAPLAFVYRLVVTLGIAWFIAQHYFLVGVILAAWALATGIVLPLGKALATVFTAPRFVARAGRVWLVLAGGIGGGVLALFVVPMPYHTRAEGVVWLPEKALLRAGADGFVSRVAAVDGQRVSAGTPVVETINPFVAAEVARQLARVEEVQARYDAAWGSRPAQAGRLAEELHREQAALDRVADQAEQLTARPTATGRLLIDRAQDLPGRFVSRGELLGYVVGPHAPIVRVVVGQEDVDRVLADTRSLDVRLAGAMGRAIPARIIRAVPKAANELPSAALGQAGGGQHVVDPRDERQVTAIDSGFEFEVELQGGGRPLLIEQLGGRAHVAFAHGAEAIGWRWLRKARRQLLSRMEV